MNLFELEAKIAVDTSEYERTVKSATDKAEDLEDSFQGVEEAAKKTEKGVDGLNDELKETANQSENASGGFTGLTSSLTGSILKANLLTKGFDLLIGAAKSLASYVWNLDDATEEYRVSQTKLNATFQTNGFSAAVAEQAYRDLYLAVGDIDRATEASQLLANLARNTADVASWTEIATGVVATFGDALPVETLIESANETARTGQVVGTLADALNWAGQIGEDEFNAMLSACATEEERVQLITDTLIGTYSEAADTFRDTAGTVMEARDAHLRLAEAQAEAGEQTTRLKNALAEETSYTMIGLNATLGFLTGKLADVVDGSLEAKDMYDGFLAAVEKKVKSDDINEVVIGLEMVKKAAQEISDGEYDLVGDLGFFGAAGYVHELNAAFEEGVDQYHALQEAGDSMDTAEVVEKIDLVTASANGLSVELENSGMTAEDASARLQTYTDAALNMFQQISTESEISYADAVANLEANIQATQDFANNMTEIASVLPGNLAEVFAAGGPGVYAGVVSMLAEANRGTDEGLTQINELWRQGGETAVNAFLSSLGMVPAEAQNPATIVAAQMEQDTSMEVASEGVVGRTFTAMSSAAASAGFDSVGTEIGAQVVDGLKTAEGAAYSAGQALINKYISGMNSRKSAAVSTASSIGSASASALNSSSGRYSAGGLDYVPYNGYPAILHSGEAVLTAAEADDWRRGQTPQARAGIVINQYITAVPQTPAELAAAAQAYFEQARWAV